MRETRTALFVFCTGFPFYIPSHLLISSYKPHRLLSNDYPKKFFGALLKNALFADERIHENFGEEKIGDKFSSFSAFSESTGGVGIF